jgi:hypothetical protein
MQIKLVSKGLVEVSENGSSAHVAFPEAKIPESAKLVFGPHVQPGVIRRPGEYEFVDIGLIALETKEHHIGTSELYSVEVSGVGCLFVMGDAGIPSKEDWDLLPEIDVMIVSLKGENAGLDKLISRLTPYYVIALDAETESEAEKVLGMKPVQSADKFKFSEKDFEAEEFATILYLMK